MSLNNKPKTYSLLNKYEKQNNDNFYYKKLQFIYKAPNNINNIRSSSQNISNKVNIIKLPMINRIMELQNKRHYDERLSRISNRKKSMSPEIKNIKDHSNKLDKIKESQTYKKFTQIKTDNKNYYTKINKM
jgi:hypothetical protein